MEIDVLTSCGSEFQTFRELVNPKNPVVKQIETIVGNLTEKLKKPFGNLNNISIWRNKETIIINDHSRENFEEKDRLLLHFELYDR